MNAAVTLSAFCVINSPPFLHKLALDVVGQAKSPLRLFFTTKLEDMDAKEVSELVASIDRNHHRGFSSNPNDVLKWERALQHR